MFKKLNNYWLISIALLIFFSGIFVERFELDRKFSKLVKETADQVNQTLYSLTSNDKRIYIFIEPRHYRKILNIRDQSLKNGMLTKDLEEWVPARLSFFDNSENIKIRVWLDNFIRNSPESENKNELLNIFESWIYKDNASNKNMPNIEIRLKGGWPEHWEDPKQWSFKLKPRNKNQNLNFDRLALQPPKTLDYIYEWLLSKALEQEKLISLPVTFSELILNNQSRGVYTVQGQISQKLILKNNREKGPIIGFTKDTWIKEQINARRLSRSGVKNGSLNGLEDTFWRSKIEPVQFRSLSDDPKQQVYLEKAIFMLESFRNNSMRTSEVFDIEKLAKVMALRALLGSSEFDYLDTKFYFNPSTSLLEPITKELMLI